MTVIHGWAALQTLFSVLKQLTHPTDQLDEVTGSYCSGLHGTPFQTILYTTLYTTIGVGHNFLVTTW